MSRTVPLSRPIRRPGGAQIAEVTLREPTVAELLNLAPLPARLGVRRAMREVANRISPFCDIAPAVLLQADREDLLRLLDTFTDVITAMRGGKE
jgi:hypothetical protein